MYEARHELLNLSTPLVKPNIPSTYFASKDQTVEYGDRKNIMRNFPDSPLTPGAGIMSDGLTSPFNQYPRPRFNSPDCMRPNICKPLLNWNNIQENQRNHINDYMPGLRCLNTSQTTGTASPGKSNPNTSGYGSSSSANTSMDAAHSHSFLTNLSLSLAGNRYPMDAASFSPTSRRFNDERQLFETEPRTPIPGSGPYNNNNPVSIFLYQIYFPLLLASLNLLFCTRLNLEFDKPTLHCHAIKKTYNIRTIQFSNVKNIFTRSVPTHPLSP